MVTVRTPSGAGTAEHGHAGRPRAIVVQEPGREEPPGEFGRPRGESASTWRWPARRHGRRQAAPGAPRRAPDCHIALAVCSESTEARAAAIGARPRRVSLSRSRARPRAWRLLTVPIGQPS